MEPLYVLDVAEAVTRVTTLRLEPTRNAQQRRIRFAADHTLTRWLRRAAVEKTGVPAATAR